MMELQPQRKAASACLVAATVAVALALFLLDKVMFLAGSGGAGGSLVILGVAALVFLAVAVVYLLLAYGLAYRCRSDLPPEGKVLKEFRGLALSEAPVLLTWSRGGIWLVKR